MNLNICQNVTVLPLYFSGVNQRSDRLWAQAWKNVKNDLESEERLFILHYLAASHWTSLTEETEKKTDKDLQTSGETFGLSHSSLKVKFFPEESKSEVSLRNRTRQCALGPILRHTLYLWCLGSNLDVWDHFSHLQNLMNPNLTWILCSNAH